MKSNTGVSVHIYTRRVTPAEEKKILQNADKANRLKAGNTGNVQDVVEAESNLQDMAAMLTLAHRNQEPFLHTAVFLSLIHIYTAKPSTTTVIS